MDTHQLRKLETLEARLQENETVTNLLWGGIKLVFLSLLAVAAGKIPTLLELLQAALEKGIVRFDHEGLEKRGQPEMASLALDLDKHYKANKSLIEFRKKVSGGRPLSPVVEKGREGGSSRPAIPKDQDEPSMG